MTDSLFPEPETLFSEPEHEPLWSALQLAGDKPPADADRGEKKNYAQRLSNQLAQTVADALRPLYPNITPTASGEGQEATVDVAKGRKRLDVKALDPTLGLILCVSIKTYNFQDYSPRSGKLGRWTKNIVRNDHELRGEAMVLHQRQPYSVLVAVMFEPYATCDDGDPTKTSDTGKSSCTPRHDALEALGSGQARGGRRSGKGLGGSRRRRHALRPLREGLHRTLRTRWCSPVLRRRRTTAAQRPPHREPDSLVHRLRDRRAR
ncbi:hypothetical protein ACETU7_24970 [Rhodococcus sp. 3Y1]